MCVKQVNRLNLNWSMASETDTQLLSWSQDSLTLIPLLWLSIQTDHISVWLCYSIIELFVKSKVYKGFLVIFLNVVQSCGALSKWIFVNQALHQCQYSPQDMNRSSAFILRLFQYFLVTDQPINQSTCNQWTKMCVWIKLISRWKV